MRKFTWMTLLALLLCIIPVTPARAASEGYIFRLTEQTTLLSLCDSSVIPEGAEAIYAPEGLFRTDDPALIRELEEAGLLAYSEPDWTVTLLDVPDDPGYTDGTQWELSALHMDYAWSRGITGADQTGTPVRIGVVDSGVFAGHEDLQGTKLLEGTNFCVSESSAARHDVSDSVGHGTFVTGILAAATGNGIGVAGLAPQAEVVPLKCFTARNGSMSDVLAAIYSGVDEYQCQVLNMSFGISRTGLNQNLPSNPQALEDAMAYAAGKGVILVAAVGNLAGTTTGNDPTLYPAGYDTVIGVGAVDREQAVCSFSYQNASVEVTAPGQQLYGLGTASRSSYVTGRGTSYSAPMVAAAAALALSVKPDLSPAEFRALLSMTAEDLGDPGWDAAYGCGQLNIGGLLEALETGWYSYEEGGDTLLAVRLEGLRPNSTIRLVQSLRSASGAQTALSLTTLTVPAEGSLWYDLPLQSGGADDTLRVFVLDEAFCPLRQMWQ